LHVAQDREVLSDEDRCAVYLRDCPNVDLNVSLRPHYVSAHHNSLPRAVKALVRHLENHMRAKNTLDARAARRTRRPRPPPLRLTVYEGQEQGRVFVVCTQGDVQYRTLSISLCVDEGADQGLFATSVCNEAAVVPLCCRPSRPPPVAAETSSSSSFTPAEERRVAKLVAQTYDQLAANNNNSTLLSPEAVLTLAEKEARRKVQEERKLSRARQVARATSAAVATVSTSSSDGLLDNLVCMAYQTIAFAVFMTPHFRHVFSEVRNPDRIVNLEGYDMLTVHRLTRRPPPDRFEFQGIPTRRCELGRPPQPLTHGAAFRLLRDPPGSGGGGGGGGTTQHTPTTLADLALLDLPIDELRRD